MHVVTKTYGPEAGLSACFRQWRANSHCRFLHGYALGITMTFAASELDGRNWVVDFGGLKPLKEAIADMLDHKTLIAKDDPELDRFLTMHRLGLIDLRVQDAVGCEAFAKSIYQMTEGFLRGRYLQSLALQGIKGPGGLRLMDVKVSEHAGNSATFAPLEPAIITDIASLDLTPHRGA